MKTAVAFLVWLAAVAAYAGKFEVQDGVDDLDGERRIGIAMPCTQPSSSVIVLTRLDANTYGFGIADTKPRLWVPDDIFKGPIKQARYRADNMPEVRNVVMRINGGMLGTEITAAEAVQILKAEKVIVAVSRQGERFTAVVSDDREAADRVAALIEADAR
jgi:hypothetical protein